MLSGCRDARERTNLALLLGTDPEKGGQRRTGKGEEERRLLKPTWQGNEYVRKYAEASVNGGRLISGPLLVIHGTADPALACEATTRAVKETMGKHPEAMVEYVRLEGVGHNGACTAGQHLWMDWIRERFEGRELRKGLREELVEGIMGKGDERHQGEINWWVAPVERAFHTP